MELENSGPEKFTSRLNLEMLKEPRYLAGASFVGGLLVGLLVLGWWLFPVKWENASAQDLRPDLQQDYLRMAIDSYNVGDDKDLAVQRMTELGEDATSIMAQISASPSDQNKKSIRFFESELGTDTSAEAASETAQELASGEEAEDGAGIFSNQSLLITMCSITGILGLALAGLYYVRRRQSASGDRPAALRAQDLTRDAHGSDFEAMGDSTPLSQWMTTYLMGDDLFDDSFSIDSSSGEFLGECGVGIAETIGVGDPKRVSAFELWLFDKNDIQTVTKVLMSNHTFKDDSARERLAAKGEPILAVPGAETVLETETLQLVVRVVDMEYGEGPLPEESYLDRVTLELAVWSKQ